MGTDADAFPLAKSPPVRRYEPLAPVAVALIIGIIAGDGLGGGMLLWCGVAATAAAVWGVLYLRGVSDRWLLVPLAILIAAAGAARYRAGVDPAPDDVARLATAGPRLMVVEGILASSVRQSSPPSDVFLPSIPYYVHSNATLDVARAQVDGRWVPANGSVRLVVRQAMPERGLPELGDRVQVIGALLPFGQPSNPGAYDVGAYLHAQGVRAFFRTNRWAAVRVTEPRADKVLVALGAFQRWAVERLDGLPTEQGRAIVAAMLFGRRDLLDFDSGQVHGEEIEHAFFATGTTHYMAVSGFNVALVVAPVLLLLRLLGIGRRVTAVIVAATVLAFLLMTELEPPVLRASILFWVVCLGWLLGRPALSFNTLAAGVIVVLLARPGDLFSASFQLSFLAVLGMLFVVRRIEESLLSPFREAHELAHPGRPPGFWYRQVVVGMLLVSVGATMVSLPVIATRFHVVSWLSPLASAILFPIVFVLTVAGMALAAFGWIAPWLGQVLAVLTDGLGRTIAGVVLALAKAPGAYFYVPDISPAWLIVLYTLMIAWVARERLGIPRRRLAIVALAAATLFVWTAGHHAPRATRATFVAVGAGNCNFLELPNGRNILYDAGSSLSNVRAAQTAIAPALWSRGIGRVDAAFFSHPHFDHFKDILPLVERFGVRQVFVPPTFLRKRLKSDKAVVQALLARGVQVEFFGAGDELAGTGDVNIRGIWPRGPAAVTKSLNLGSLVLQVTDGPRRLLLTGDLTPGGMEALARAEPGLRADAALWPHHGHDPDAFGRFAAAVGARTVVISDGRPFLPRASPPWLRALGGKCYHTGEDGAVTLELRPAGVYAETFAGGPQVLCDLPEPEEDADSADD